jgi:hypothetical protein
VRDIADNVTGYRIVHDEGRHDPPIRLLEAVATGAVDMAVVRGPFAGYAITRRHLPPTMHSVTPATDRSGQRVNGFVDHGLVYFPRDKSRYARLPVR